MGWILFAVGTLLGSVIGVVLMCLLQINRLDGSEYWDD